MAEADTVILTRRERFFPVALVAGLAIVVAGLSFFEHDRRGMLRWDRPSIFAAGEIAGMPGSYEITYLGYSAGSGRGSPLIGGDEPDRILRREIPRRADTTGLAPDTGAPSAVAGVPAQSIAPQGGDAVPLAAAASPSSEGGTSGRVPFTPGGLGGAGATPPGLIPTGANPAPPVIPAVPEPAAWLLMILGVGVLAGAMRSHARRHAECVEVPLLN